MLFIKYLWLTDADGLTDVALHTFAKGKPGIDAIKMLAYSSSTNNNTRPAQ